MTQPKQPLPKGVKSESILFRDATGGLTDKNNAVSAEITTTYDDGRVEHTLMKKNQRGA